MRWTVLVAPEFQPELAALESEVRVELLAQARLIEQFGPAAKRPRVDTLNGSRHANMKELRFDAGGGVWRVAFDPRRAAILLVAGDKSGQSERTFYKRLIEKADERFRFRISSGLLPRRRSESGKASSDGKDAS